MRLLVLAIALCAVPAVGQPRRVGAVALSSPGATDLDAAEAARALAAHVQSDPRFEWVSPATQARDDGPIREAKGSDARGLFLEAREQLDNMQLPKAMATLDKCIKFYEESDLSQGTSGLTEALALRALAALAKNDKASFTTDAQRVLAMTPTFTWDPSRLTPQAQAALAPIKKKAASTAPVTLQLDSSPQRAWAYVDGVFKGLTPLSVESLPAGSHVVTLVATGYELLQERVFAGPGASASWPLRSSPRGKDVLAAMGDLRAAADRSDVSGAAGQLAKQLLLEELLVATVKQTKGEGRALKLWRVLSDGTLVAESEKEVAFPAEAGAAWAVLAKEVLAAPAPERHVQTESGPGNEVSAKSGGSSLRRPLALVGAALAVVSLGVGIGLGVTAKARATEANALPQVDVTGYQRLAGQARAQALVADVLFGVAVVAAGVSLFLLITSISSGSPAENEEAVSLAWGAW